MSEKTKRSANYCRSRKKGTYRVVIFSVLFFIAASSVGFILLKSSQRAEPTLRFLSIVHRHGERAPEVTYPLDPYKNDESLWPDGLGQLLQKGKVTMFELGRLLRHRYDGFIPSRYKSNEVFVLASVYDRCMMSAQLVLAGLYPPVGNQIWNTELLWQPIPVFSVPAACDDMILIEKPCPLLLKEKKHVDTNLIQKILNENTEILDIIFKNTGLKVETIFDVQRIYDNLLVKEQQGLKIPEWAKDVYPNEMKNLSMMALMGVFDTTTMIKLKSGVLINDILSKMRNKASGQLERVLNLYSAHDTTMTYIWRGMTITQELPEKFNYGAALVIELHEINRKHRGKILFKNHAGSEKEMQVLSIKGCEADEAIHQDKMCDFYIFSTTLQYAAITNFDKECQILQ